MIRPVETIPVANTLGECVLWDHRAQAVWWADIEKRRLYRYAWPHGPLEQIETPERPCSFGFIEGSRRLIVAFESGFAVFAPESGEVRWLHRIARAGMRMNDGRVDRQGRFWAGGMAEHAGRAGTAELYCIDADNRLAVHERGLTISNGLCWSPDGGTLYLADSPTKTIWQYRFDAPTGTISNRAVFAVLTEGMPDGAAVDREGFVWTAVWGAACVIRYAPDGTIDRQIDLPVTQPTCVTFGGRHLDILFVTTATCDLDAEALKGQPSAGDLFAFDIGTAGLPECRCALRVQYWSQDHDGV